MTSDTLSAATAMCFPFMVQAAKHDMAATKNILVKSALDRLRQISQLQEEPVSRPLSQISTDVKINVQIVMAGTPSIMEGRLVAVLSQVIPTLHQDMHVEFLPAIFFEVAKGNVIHISDVAEAYGQTFNGKVRTMNDFSNEFESLATEWAKMNTKFIFVANVGLPETSDEQVADTDVTRIHRSDTEWMWAFAHAALGWMFGEALGR